MTVRSAPVVGEPWAAGSLAIKLARNPSQGFLPGLESGMPSAERSPGSSMGTQSWFPVIATMKLG